MPTPGSAGTVTCGRRRGASLRACELYGATPDQIRASGVTVDGFGRVKAGVPYVTCMACGLHADATADPNTYKRGGRESGNA